MATAKIEEYGSQILPDLILAAQRRETITYGALTEIVGIYGPLMNRTLAYIRDELCSARGLPLLTAIVVNKRTGRPGDRFLPEGTDQLTNEQYQIAFEEHRDRVFSYQGWNDFLLELGLVPIAKSPDDLDKEGRIYNEVMARRGGEESNEHRQLKQYIASAPALLGLSARNSAIEFLFVSGDRCDVVFDLEEQGMAVIEVKHGERGELVKGVYQAVKYRALMEAEKGHGAKYLVQAHLVAYSIPEDIEAFAGKFKIKCHTVSRETVLNHL